MRPRPAGGTANGAVGRDRQAALAGRPVVPSHMGRPRRRRDRDGRRGGRRWLLDAATGRVLHDDPTATEPWPRDPVRLPGGVCIIPDCRTLTLLDPASGRDVWMYTLPGVTTRTGAAPRVSVGSDALLV